jgi:hypothetical protein
MHMPVGRNKAHEVFVGITTREVVEEHHSMIIRETATGQVIGIGPNKEAAIANALATLNAMWDGETTRAEMDERLQRGINQLEPEPTDDRPRLEPEM